MTACTLVLDNSYRPVARITWDRALSLFFKGKVEIVEEYEDREVRSVTFTFKLPSIVRLLRSMRGKNRPPKFSRENVYVRDRGSCQYCGEAVSHAQATYDHVLPRAQGGKTEWTNIVIACMKCNQRKGNRTPEQAKMALRSKPQRPKKLSDCRSLTLTWKPGDPDTWKDWLAVVKMSVAYWHAELEE